MRSELPTVAARPSTRASATGSAWSRFLAVIADRNLQLVAGFCTIGFLLAINMILLFPGFEETAATLEMFP